MLLALCVSSELPCVETNECSMIDDVTTITMAYLRSGLSIKYVPIQTLARKGKSKIKLFQDGIRFLLIITRIATLFSPFCVFLPVSFIIFYCRPGVLYIYVYNPASSYQYVNAAVIKLRDHFYDGIDVRTDLADAL